MRNYKTIALIALLIALLTGIALAERTRAFCDLIDVTLVGDVPVWNNAAYAFQSPAMPDDLRVVDLLYIDEDMNAAYMIYHSASDGSLWVFPFWSLGANADANGEHEGNHNFCMPRVYALGDR
jgi:hypothetical protein